MEKNKITVRNINGKKFTEIEEVVGTLATETETAFVNTDLKRYFKATWYIKNDEDKRFYNDEEYYHYGIANTILIAIDPDQLKWQEEVNGQIYDLDACPKDYIREFLYKELDVNPDAKICITEQPNQIELRVKLRKLRKVQGFE